MNLNKLLSFKKQYLDWLTLLWRILSPFFFLSLTSSLIHVLAMLPYLNNLRVVSLNMRFISMRLRNREEMRGQLPSISPVSCRIQ